MNQHLNSTCIESQVTLEMNPIVVKVKLDLWYYRAQLEFRF